MYKPEIVWEKWTTEDTVRLWNSNGWPRRNLAIMNKEKTVSVDSGVSVNPWVKLYENEKLDKYLALSRVLKKVWNMNVTVVPIIDGVLGTRLEELEIWGKKNWNIPCNGTIENGKFWNTKENWYHIIMRENNQLWWVWKFNE